MKKFVIVDIETTGNTPKNGDRIVQFAAVVVEKGAINHIFTTYINPEIPIPPFISELTGIENSDVAEAPFFADVADKIRELFEDACFVAHNVHFDLNFLQEELKKAGKSPLTCPYLDTVELSRIFMPTLDSYKLSDLAAYAGFDHDRPHQADSDALVTAEWFLTLIDKALQLPIETLNQLKDLSYSLKNHMYEFFDLLCHWKKGEKKRRDDLEIFHGLALKKWQSHLLNREYVTPLTCKKTEISKMIKRGFGQSYEHRLGQLDMADTVRKALQEGDIAFIEAEPGFGKTVSYLLPAAITALEEKKPVVVAVHTIQKQNEIIDKEIPKVEKMVERPIYTAIVKGRRHYLNLWNFERLLQSDSENYDETITKMQILVWLTETETGDGDELNLTAGGMLFWQRLAMAEVTDRMFNPWKERDFFARVVERAKKAHLIITNHHFLIADMTGKQKVLPDFHHIIIDEAHQFERNTAKYFGNRISYRKIKYLLNQLGAVDQNKLLGNMLKMTRQNGIQLVSHMEMQRLMEQFTEENGDFFQILLNQFRQMGVSPSGKSAVAVSLTDGGPLQYAWERFYNAYNEFFRKLKEIYRHSLNNWTAFNDEEKLLTEDFANYLHEFEEIEHIQKESIHHAEDRILWAETDDRKSITSLVLYSQPLDVGKTLVDVLFTKKKGILFISNSLTVQDSFLYVKTQLGLNEFPVIEKKYTSSVAEEKRPNLYILEDMPEIQDMKNEEYTELMASSIISLAESINGRVLILFTSHDMLKNTYYLIKESGALEDYLLLAQGISSGSAHRLARQFNRFSKALLFGSYTFWEGADIDRELLSAVIMVRLPFTSPNNPVHREKSQLIKNRNGNSFYEHSLPEAVIRFKQGISKLFYSKKQKGSIIVFDRRLQSRTYGKVFLQSIPTLDVEILTIGELCQKIEEHSLEEQ